MENLNELLYDVLNGNDVVQAGDKYENPDGLWVTVNKSNYYCGQLASEFKNVKFKRRNANS